METYYVLSIVLIALVFDFSNGLNDAANSIATVVATRVLSPRAAVLWAAFFNFIAAFLFETHVARTIGKGLVAPSIINPHLILAALIAAIVWTLLCTWKGLPISVSHSLIGALAGAALCKAGPDALVWKKIGVVAIFIVLSPLSRSAVRGPEHARDALDLPPAHTARRGSRVSLAPARVRGGLQPEPRTERCAEDDGDCGRAAAERARTSELGHA
jgi:hypothetical protein